MSIQDIQIDSTRQNQDEAIKSKEWEQVRNKKFQEEEFLWNDSQFNINAQKEHKKTLQNIQIQLNQSNLQMFDSEVDHSQKQNSKFKSANSRRFQYISKYTTSRTKTNELDSLNINDISLMNQAQEFVGLKDLRICSQICKPPQDLKTNNRSSLGGNKSKIMVFITKLKMRLKNYILYNNKLKKFRSLNSDIRVTINDYSDLSSKTGFYLKLTLVWLNIIYLILFSIFIVFQVKDSFSEKVFQVINFVWIVDLTFNFNCQIQQDTEIIRKTFFFYVKKRFLFDFIPLILNSQLQLSSSTLLFQMFQFVKLVNINHDLKYIQLQLCMRVQKHYIIQLMNLIFGLFFIGHIIACLWYLIGYLETNFLEDENSWLNSDLYKNSSWQSIYFSSLYWSLTLMATGSNISLGNLEIMFTTIIMLFTSICFGYLITIIGDILTEMNSKELKSKQDMNLINNYMRQANISKQIYLFQKTIITIHYFEEF